MGQRVHARLEVRGVAVKPYAPSQLHLNDTSLGLGWGVAGALELPMGGLLYASPGVGWRTMQYQFAHGEFRSLMKAQDLCVPLNLGLRLKLLGVGLAVEGGVWGRYVVEAKMLESVSTLAREVADLQPSRLSYGFGANAALELGLLYLRAGVELDMKERPKYIENAPLHAFVALGVRF